MGNSFVIYNKGQLSRCYVGLACVNCYIVVCVQVIYTAGSTIPFVAAYVIGLLNVAYAAFRNCTIFVSFDYQTAITID